MEFNSKEYTFCDIVVIVLGRPVGTLRGIEYKVKKNKEALYAAGNKARSIQHGKREIEGTLTILQSDLIALDRAAQESGKKDCLDLDFDIVVSYVGENLVVTTDRIVTASLTDSSRSMKEGDLFMEVPLSFIALDVKTNLI